MDAVDKRINGLKDFFTSFNFSYTMKNVKFFNTIGKSYKDLRVYSEMNLVYLIAAATSSQSLDEAFEICDKVLTYGVSLETFHKLFVSEMDSKGFFPDRDDLKIWERLSLQSEKNLEELLKDLQAIIPSLEKTL